MSDTKLLMAKQKKKAQFTVKIDREVANRFKSKILISYGTTYGVTSSCVEEALDDWTNKFKTKTKGDKK